MSYAEWRILDCLSVSGLGFLIMQYGHNAAGWCFVGIGFGLLVGNIFGTLWPLDGERR
jgi:hypothetical protein